MSLLNNMLRDLDARRAAPGERKELPGDVHPLSGARPRRFPPLLAGAVLLLALAAAWWWLASRSPGLPPAAPVPQPAVAIAPAPIPGAATPSKPVAPAPRVAATPAAKPSSPAAVPAAPAVADRIAAPGAADKAMAVRPQPGQARIEKTPLVAPAQVQADAAYRRGQTLLAQGAAAEAEAAFNQALRLTPEHAGARQALFGLLVEQQRKDEARDLLEAGVAILPGHVSWAMNIARLQMEKNDAAGAWATLQRSLPGAQANGEYRAFCGTVLQRLGRSQEAIPHFHAALATNPAEGRWWLGLALVLESAGHPAEAREAFARAKAAGNLPPDLAAFAEQKSRP